MAVGSVENKWANEALRETAPSKWRNWKPELGEDEHDAAACVDETETRETRPAAGGCGPTKGAHCWLIIVGICARVREKTWAS